MRQSVFIADVSLHRNAMNAKKDKKTKSMMRAGQALVFLARVRLHQSAGGLQICQ